MTEAIRLFFCNSYQFMYVYVCLPFRVPWHSPLYTIFWISWSWFLSVWLSIRICYSFLDALAGMHTIVFFFFSCSLRGFFLVPLFACVLPQSDWWKKMWQHLTLLRRKLNLANKCNWISLQCQPHEVRRNTPGVETHYLWRRGWKEYRWYKDVKENKTFFFLMFSY